MEVPIFLSFLSLKDKKIQHHFKTKPSFKSVQNLNVHNKFTPQQNDTTIKYGD